MELRSINNLVHLCKALSSPLRLKILCLVIKEGKISVNSLVEKLERSYPLVSQHLRFLASAYILVRKREGRNVYYVLASPERERRLPEEVFQAIKKYLSSIKL